MDLKSECERMKSELLDLHMVATLGLRHASCVKTGWFNVNHPTMIALCEAVLSGKDQGDEIVIRRTHGTGK